MWSTWLSLNLMSSGITPSHTHHTLTHHTHHTNHTLTHHTHHTSHIPHTHCTMFVCLSSLQGVVVISEPLLDCSLVGLTSDWECITLSLTPRSAGCEEEMTLVPLYSHRLHPLLSLPKHNFITNNPSQITPPLLPSPSTHAHIHTYSPQSQHPLVNTTTVVPDPSPSSQRHSLRSEFEQEIQDILYSGGVRESVPRLRRHTGEGQQEYSQQECFRFLSHSIEQLTTRFLLRQQKAKARLKQRCRTELAVTPQSLFMCPQSILYVPSPFQRVFIFSETDCSVAPSSPPPPSPLPSPSLHQN